MNVGYFYISQVGFTKEKKKNSSTVEMLPRKEEQ